jgi:rSAM/selenodomain-associated transferase 2
LSTADHQIADRQMILVSVIIPVYRDTDTLARMLAATDFGGAEIIVVSTADDAASLAPLRTARADVRWVDSGRGRAAQMNAGAAVATGSWLLFLHADTRLPPDWPSALADAARRPGVVFGCFRFALDSPRLMARAIELGVRLRVALFDLPYGDQAIFVRRHAFDAIGGYTVLPIMEDVDLVRRLGETGRLWRASKVAVTSARRWERLGWVRVTVQHVKLIVLYFLGVAPERLKCSHAD